MDKSGTQIDLLIDRPDGVINLCEMKWSGAPFVIDKRYAATLRERVEIFRRVTGTRKSLFLTFVTANGIAPGDYVTELVANEVNATRCSTRKTLGLTACGLVSAAPAW
jgi:hypothetical protein